MVEMGCRFGEFRQRNGAEFWENKFRDSEPGVGTLGFFLSLPSGTRARIVVEGRERGSTLERSKK
jgi:hypothetical protein